MKRPLVALIVETSSVYGRRILDGIAQYVQEHTEWRVLLEQRSLHDRSPLWLRDWHGNGVVSRATTPRIAEELRKSGLPVVDLTDRAYTLDAYNPTFPQIISDDFAIGELAAYHFLKRRFRSFAFSGFVKESWSHYRSEGYRQTLAEHHLQPSVLESPWEDLEARTASAEDSRVIAWLLGLPKPVGIFCCNDVRAHQIQNACFIAGLAIPRDVAILGVDDDAILCEVSRPAISSIVPNPQFIGFRAAEVLDAWLSGKTPSPTLELVQPLGIRMRESTDLLPIDDPPVLHALQLIREKACEGISIDEIVQQVGLTRSSLERRFRKWLNHSPQHELRVTQMARARTLLDETDLSLKRIAELVGIGHPEYLHVVFKRIYQVSPGEYRRKLRMRDHRD